MPFIYTKDLYNDFFKTGRKEMKSNIPRKLRGVWSLDNISGISPSVAMTFETAEVKDDNVLIVDLSKPNTWLFKTSFSSRCFTFLIKRFRYSYKFEFDKTYSKAKIRPMIWGRVLPLKGVIDFDLECKNGKIIRESELMCFSQPHTYESNKMIDERGRKKNGLEDISEKYDKLYVINKNT